MVNRIKGKYFSSASILLVMLALTACAPSTSSTSSTLPTWERKSAPAVIMGRITDWKPGDKDKYPGYWGNRENLKGNSFAEETSDSIAGTFTFVWDICYPLLHQFHGWSILLFPGDTVRLDFNRAAFAEYQAYNSETPRDSITTTKLQELWKKAIHTEGGTFEQPLPIHIKGIELGVSRDCAIAHAHDSFDEWREICWNEFQDVVKQLDTPGLSGGQRAYRRMMFEQDYLTKLRNFMFVKKSWNFITDKDSLEMFEKQFTWSDPHASELTYYRDITGFYACLNNMFDEGRQYIQANELEDSPLGRWFKELDEAKDLMAQAKANQPVAESELDALSPEFQAQIREVQALFKQEAASNEGVRRTLPEGEPQEWLPKIVAEHKGHIVFIDFWATWCGPCRIGMKALETVKDELTARGVDFIYITNTSSSSDEWLDYVAGYAGDHYIVPKEKMKEMQIPDYENAIPHYLIYDREGRLANAIVGWPGGVEVIVEEIAKLK